MMEDKKIYTGGIKSEGKLAKWFDNYWYHYKWITIGVIFFIVVVLVCTLQMCEKEGDDTVVLYAGPYQLSGAQMEGIRGVINTVMPDDFNGDGKKYTAIVNYYILSEDQIKEIEAETDEYGVRLDVNNQYITQNYDSYYDYIQTGESPICLVDRHLYSELVRYGRLLPLSVALDDSSYEDNEYGLVFSKLDIYAEYSALRVLPEDTVLCFLRQTVVKPDDSYENDKAIFKAIVGFEKTDE
jgi:hypothetical protein